MHEGGVKTSVSAYWIDNPMPSDFFSEAVSTSTLFSVKHKISSASTPKSCKGWLVCRADVVRQTKRVWATPWNMADGILRMPCRDDREDRSIRRGTM